MILTLTLMPNLFYECTFKVWNKLLYLNNQSNFQDHQFFFLKKYIQWRTYSVSYWNSLYYSLICSLFVAGFAGRRGVSAIINSIAEALLDGTYLALFYLHTLCSAFYYLLNRHDSLGRFHFSCLIHQFTSDNLVHEIIIQRIRTCFQRKQ